MDECVFHGNNIGVGTIITHTCPVEDPSGGIDKHVDFTGVIVAVGEVELEEGGETDVCWLVDYIPFHPEEHEYVWQPISAFIQSSLRVVEGCILPRTYDASGVVLKYKEHWWDVKE